MFSAASPGSLDVVEVDASHLEAQGHAIEAIFEGDIAGVIVKGAFDPRWMDEVVNRLSDKGGELPSFHPPIFKGFVLGRPLVASDGDLRGYLDDADAFRAGCAEIVRDYPKIEARLQEMMQALAVERRVEVPSGEDGRSYLAATFRVLIEGDRLPLHYENETFGSPVMESLLPSLDPATLMSFYIPLRVPRSGGEMRLFRLHCLNGGDSLISDLGGEEEALKHFEERGFVEVLPEIGDLLVFDGGRWYHDVTPVVGGQRWTLGGFLALTAGGSGVRYWS